MRKSILSLACIGAIHAFAPPPQSAAPCGRTALLSTLAAEPTSSAPANRNQPTWEVKQHLYGLDMVEGQSDGGMSVTVGADGEVTGGGAGGGLPLPEKYITCGKCKSLYAIAEADLGDKGKGCRVKCSVCGNSWYQTRERLFDIPTSTHDMIPAHQSDLDRIARNLARDVAPAFGGVGKLYVGNLDWTTTSDDLMQFFKQNSEGGSEICDVSVVTGPDGRSRGFAFVTFYDERHGKSALACDGMQCNGRAMSVREPNN